MGEIYTNLIVRESSFRIPEDDRPVIKYLK